MTELLSGVEAPSDAELISRVRGGETAAYGELFNRHVEAARRLGRQLVRGPDVDDLVSEAFAKMLHVLQGGGGPDVAFRAYLLTSVRRLHVDRIRATARVQPAEDMTVYDAGIPFQDTAVASFENAAAAKAFSSLPERWQLVLWHLEVEGQKPAEIAPLLGMSANSVSALAYRAREGLRQAFLTMHLADAATDDCRWVNEHLGAYVRKGLSRRDTTKVDDHLEECRRCTAMYLELTEVNSNLSGIIAPLLLGAAAAGYLSSSGAAGGLTGVSALFGRVRDTVSANATATVGGVVAAGVAAITTAALVLGGGAGREAIVEADQPVGTVEIPGAADPGDTGPGEQPRDGSGDRSANDAEPVPADDTAVVPAATTPDGLLEPAVEPPPDPAVTDPGTTDPGTTDPGTTDPGTTDPGGGAVDGPDAPPDDVPGPGTSPGTPPIDDPGTPPIDDPGTPPVDDPGTPPVDDPGTPPAVETSLRFGSASVDGTDLVFELVGDPVLPPTVTVRLSSDPAGITFDETRSGDCPTQGTSATCTPVPITTASGAVAFRAVAASTGTYRARIPLRIPATQHETTLSISATVPDGYVDLAGASFTFTYTPPPSDGDDGGDGDGDGGNPGDGDGGNPGGGDGNPGGGDGDNPGGGDGNPGGGDGGNPGGGDGGTPDDDDEAIGPFRIVSLDNGVIETADDQHVYRVTVTFAGVRAGDVVRIELSGPQARVCADGCTANGSTDSVSDTVTSERSQHTVVFTARLPGKSQSTIEVTLNGGSRLTHSLA